MALFSSSQDSVRALQMSSDDIVMDQILQHTSHFISYKTEHE